ncbi:MAG: hypothetical protein HKP58_03370 [Desulfatitalea sp.]|nr:hypothetical protein [Desulfatitalea sp.]NNJ99432.1 hypothetical protein [Desulfatitalea sp.]
MIGLAEPSHDLIETLPSGDVNWTSNVLTAEGTHVPGPASSRSAGVLQARQNAATNLLLTLQRIRMDAYRTAADIMHADDRVNAKIVEMIQAVPVAQEANGPGGRVDVTVEMPLLGGLAQLMLPDEIKQVRSIRQVGDTAIKEELTLEAAAGSEPEMPYTGLVVDARGIGIKPAMAPAIVDENGKQVYGSAFVSREFAVQYGVCRYTRDPEARLRKTRIAPHPLSVKGLRTLPGRDCDIMISNADAAKLRDASDNIGFLKQCRVMIIVD